MPMVAQMRHPATRALYAYWNAVRAGRRAPRRLEIQPAQLGGLLLDTFILERTGRSAFVFRLAGTRVSSWLGADLRTRNFLGCWGEADRAMLERHLSAITDLGRAGVFTGEGYPPAGPDQAACGGTAAPFELIVLPLMHTGQAIDRLLCLLVPLDGAGPAADGAAVLSAGRRPWPSRARPASARSVRRRPRGRRTCRRPYPYRRR